MKKKKKQHGFREPEKIMNAYKKFIIDDAFPEEPQPQIIRYGRRTQVLDIENNAYTDYCLAGGRLILGHAHRNVVLGVKKNAEKGILIGRITSEEVMVAKHIVESVASIEKVKFFTSEKESLDAAVTLAQKHTKKQGVLIFDLAQYTPNHPSNDATIFTLPFNNTSSTEKFLSENKDKIACVLIDPISIKMGIIPSEIEFVKMLSVLCKKYNIVLICDETTTGFRCSKGCLQSDMNFMPDLTVLAGIIGGGFPLAVLGGRGDILQLTPQGGGINHKEKCLSPVIMRASLMTLRLLTENFYNTLNQRANKLAEDVNATLKKNNVAAYVSNYNSMMSIYFKKTKPKNSKEAVEAFSKEKYSLLRKYLLAAGILFPLTQKTPFYVTMMHSKKELHELLTSLKKFFMVDAS